MKQGIHPDYREVVFQDEDAGFAFLTRSTIKTNETIQWEDGNEYPLVKLEISSASLLFSQASKNLLTLLEELKDLNNVTDLQAHDKHLKLKYLLKKKNNLAFLYLLCLILIFLMAAKL